MVTNKTEALRKWLAEVRAYSKPEILNPIPETRNLKPPEFWNSKSETQNLNPEG